MDKKEKVKKFLEITEALKGYEEYVKNLPAAILQLFQLQHAVRFSAEETQKKLELITPFVEETMKQMNEGFIQIYDDFFTEEEVDELIVLHQRPVLVKARQNDERIEQEILKLREVKAQELDLRLRDILMPPEAAEEKKEQKQTGRKRRRRQREKRS
jgi:hypothetical protein